MTPVINITTTPEGYLLKMKRMTRDTFTPSIETLKRVIPASHRSFDADTKEWFVASEADVELNTWL